MTPFLLLALPCGCAHILHGPPDRYVVCPWCDAAFDAEELGEWIDGAEMPEVLFEPAPPRLVRWGSRVVEVVGQVGFAPIVREFGVPGRFSLPVLSLNGAERLWN